MQGNQTTTRINLLMLIAFGALIILSAGLSPFSSPKPVSAISVHGSSLKIVSPAATNLCLNGCRAHQNWISFYLASNTYIEKSLRLKTSLFWGQILTYGISSTPCLDQIKPGYTCIDMEISHRLLGLLIGLNLTPLDQLRNINNWWLEYTPANLINQ